VFGKPAGKAIVLKLFSDVEVRNGMFQQFLDNTLALKLPMEIGGDRLAPTHPIPGAVFQQNKVFAHVIIHRRHTHMDFICIT